MLQVLSQRPAQQQESLTERQVAEPLLGYFSYGLLRNARGVSRVGPLASAKALEAFMHDVAACACPLHAMREPGWLAIL